MTKSTPQWIIDKYAAYEYDNNKGMWLVTDDNGSVCFVSAEQPETTSESAAAPEPEPALEPEPESPPSSMFNSFFSKDQENE